MNGYEVEYMFGFKRGKTTEEREREYKKRIEYNRSHLPSAELPPLKPDWYAVNEFIVSTQFRIRVENGAFTRFSRTEHKWENIPVGDYDSDTLKLLELIYGDLMWFYHNSTGLSVPDELAVLREFMQGKYPELSDKSILYLACRYGEDNR